MREVIRALCGGACLAASVGAFAAGTLTDRQVRQQIVGNSLRSYPGNRPCLYNADRAGRQCGGRSAWSRAGGYSAYAMREVSGEQVRAYRARHESERDSLRGHASTRAHWHGCFTPLRHGLASDRTEA
jgi:hypothetical protein